ncbi:MAG: VCBS repeat-containing protein, partial [Acidobacteriota bacterium]|nr:VCBS repeat-containing protein [Acidobacteriota bacterium]
MTSIRRGGAVRLAGATVLIHLAVSCTGPGEAAPSSTMPPTRDDATIVMSDCGESVGIDVVQVGGGPDVDYIIESIGMGGAWLDYDNDGDPDLYLAQGATNDAPRNGPPDRLLRNDGDPDGDGIPGFTDVTGETGLGDRRWSFGVATADYDNDGDADIYLLNWGRNRLYRNNGDGTFTDVAEAAGLADPRWST